MNSIQPLNCIVHTPLKYEKPNPNKFCSVLGASNCICSKKSTIPSLNYYHEDLEMFKKELGEILKLDDDCLIVFRKLRGSLIDFLSELTSFISAWALEDLLMTFLISLNQTDYPDEKFETIKTINSEMKDLFKRVLKKEDDINLDNSKEKYKEMLEIIDCSEEE